MSKPERHRHQSPAVSVRAVGVDRAHQRPGRRRAVMLRLSDSELAQITEAAREAGLTPSGYAAEAALAAARGGEAPAREPLRVALSELIAARVEVTRLVRLLAGLSSSGQQRTSGETDPSAVVRALTGVDHAAAAVTASLP